MSGVASHRGFLLSVASVRQVDAVVVVDNSILAPVFQQPLALGADISMTSATKFIAGHSDVTGGILSVKHADLAQRIYFYQVLSCPSPDTESVAALAILLRSCSLPTSMPVTRQASPVACEPVCKAL